MGRPGGGAPQKTSSGKLKNFRIEDPQLRFQFHAPDRNMVDNDLRYRMSLKDQRAYKKELGKNYLLPNKRITCYFQLNILHIVLTNNVDRRIIIL